MGSESAPAPAAVAPVPLLPDVRVRAWPTAILAGVYWIFQLVVAQTDMPMFNRFLSGALSALAFLVLFLILWLSNGTLAGRIRLIGLGLLIGSAALGILLAHPSFQAVGFLMTSVPPILTGWAVWMYLARWSGPREGLPVLILAVLLGFLSFDLLRWDGLDGRLRSSSSWRWARTAEDEFLASKGGAPKPAESVGKPWIQKAGDCPEFRGTQRDGVVRGIRIETNWKDVLPTLAWKHRVGPGWSGMIVVGGNLVTQEQWGESEAIVCYDAETGREVWRHEDHARFSEGIAGPGPRATPTFQGGRLYSVGGSGLVTCLEAPTGKLVWRHDLAKDSPGSAPQWGYSASPLVVDGKVIVFAGGPAAKGIVALGAADGAPVWTRLVGKESYSSLQLVSAGGKPQLLMTDNKAMTGLSPADGAVLWERPSPSDAVIPMLQSSPLGDGDVLVPVGLGLGRIQLKEEGGKWSVVEKWSTPKFRPSFSNFVFHEGHVYGVDEGVLACFDAQTGERVWRKERVGSGQLLLLADQGVLLVLTEKGELLLVDAKPVSPGEVFRFQAIDGKTWNQPTVAGDRLFVRNGLEMACYRLRVLKSS